MGRNRVVLSLCACLLISGCTEPGETTGYGAAAGGVLGAGLGAIVGNQTGSAGTGLVVGSVAGASAGAAVGNAIEAQNETIRQQDEILARQERLLQAQRQEVAALRAAERDASSPAVNRGQVSHAARPLPRRSTVIPERYKYAGLKPRNQPSAAVHRASPPQRPVAAVAKPKVVRERDITPRVAVEKPVEDKAPVAELFPPSDEAQQTDEFVEWKDEPVEARAMLSPGAVSDECNAAESEQAKAERAVDTSQKLFHLRRALRLCPDNPSYHNDLGELYLKLNRGADARFEFNEALRLDPSFGPARDNLRMFVDGASE